MDINLESLFDINRTNRNRIRLAPEDFKKILNEKGIPCKIKPLFKEIKIVSFQGMSCPMCGSTKPGAWASEPYYTLYCRNPACKAVYLKGEGLECGVPAIDWAGIDTGWSSSFNMSNPLLYIPSVTDISVIEARAQFIEQLKNDESNLFVITPGVGKTHTSVKHYSKQAKEKIIIFSSATKKRQRKSYKKAKRFTDHAFIIKSKYDGCKKQREMDADIERGYLPSRYLCKKCIHRKRNECESYLGQKKVTTGIFFITHHMLPYLSDKFENVDVIVLDEQVFETFRQTTTMNDDAFRSLGKIIDDSNYQLIEKIIDLSNKISGEYVRDTDKIHPEIVNAVKVTDDGTVEINIKDLILKHFNWDNSLFKKKIQRIIKTITEHERELYQNNANIKPKVWLEGLINDEIYSYISFENNGKITFKTKFFSAFNYTAPVKILDATGNKQIAERILKRKIKCQRIDVGFKSKSFHIIKDTAKSSLSKLNDTEIKELIKSSIAKMKLKNEKVLIASWDFLMERIKSICKSVAAETGFKGEFKFLHFFGGRGSNDYKDCTSVIVIGLPYPNINELYLDAHMLFDTDEVENRQGFGQAIMEWELYQIIHRLRPIYKPNGIKILIAAKYFPLSLPQPTADNIFDCTKNYNWMDAVIARMKPCVSLLNLVNDHVAFLSGVFISNKEKSYNKYVENIRTILDSKNIYLNQSTIQDIDSIQLDSAIYNLTIYNHIDIYNINHILIFLLYIIQREKLRYESMSYDELELFSLIKNNMHFHDHPISINTNQWNKVKCHFRNKSKLFNDFKMNLKYSRNHRVNGTGIQNQIQSSHKILCKLNLERLENLDSLKFIGIMDTNDIHFVTCVIYVHRNAKKSNDIYLGYKDILHKFVLNDSDYVCSTDNNIRLNDLLQSIFNEDSDDLKCIVTNDSKSVSKELIKIKLNNIRVYDVCLNEIILCNNNLKPVSPPLESLIDKYQITHDSLDSLNGLAVISDIWEQQGIQIVNAGAEIPLSRAAITGKKLTLLMVQYCPPRLLRIS